MREFFMFTGLDGNESSQPHLYKTLVQSAPVWQLQGPVFVKVRDL